MKRRFFFTLCLLSALAAPAAHARQEPKPLRISYVRAPFNLQLMVMKEKGILQKHLEPLGLQAQWPEITSGAKQAQALASGDLDIGGVMNTASVLMANGEGKATLCASSRALRARRTFSPSWPPRAARARWLI